MVWFDMVWYDTIWAELIWYDMIWYDLILFIELLEQITGEMDPSNDEFSDFESSILAHWASFSTVMFVH